MENSSRMWKSLLPVAITMVAVACTPDNTSPTEQTAVTPSSPAAAPTQTPPSKQTPPTIYDKVNYSIGDPAARNLAERALRVLVERCRLEALANDLAVIRVSVEALGSLHYLYESYGWWEAIRVEPQFREEVPRQVAGRQVGGHTFDFRIGAGREPGVTADKWIGKAMCGLDPDLERTQFLGLPELAFLEELTTPASAAASPARVDFTRVFGKDPEELKGVLGEPRHATEDTSTHVYRDLLIIVRYEEGKAESAELASTKKTVEELKRWLGKQKPGVKIFNVNSVLSVRKK